LLAYLISFSFTPTLYVLGYGHITTLHLMGIVLFLYFLLYQSRIRDISAGFAIALILLKPQLLLLFLAAILLWIITNRRWWILFGILTFVTLNLSMALLFNHQIIAHYLDAVAEYPMGTWATPTLGMLLRLYFGAEKNWLQIFPSIVGIIWIGDYWLKRRSDWNWYRETPLLLLVSFVFSPYMWTYDMVLLVIPIIYIFAQLSNLDFTTSSIISSIAYIFLNVSALILHRTNPDYWFFWFAPALLIWFYLIERSIKKSLIIRTPQQRNSAINI
jgi:hypothetical protein